MMPVYRYMDSSPLQADQMPSPQIYHPSFGVVPPLMKVDPSKSTLINQPGLYPNNFGYSVPFYPCYTNGSSPGYFGHPPCPYFSSPQFHCCAHHPHFPDAFPVHYVTPPQYLKELPRYDYDKPGDSDFHCCGCPNHTHNQKNGGSVKVEEVPNVDKKMSDSLVPVQLKNYPYPVFWIPPEYMKNIERRMPLESDTTSTEKASHALNLPKNGKPYEHEPKERNGFPFDLKSLQSLMQGDDERRMYDQQNEDKVKKFPFSPDMKRFQSLIQGNDGRRTQDQKNEDKMGQFPFPIIWMPPYYKQGDNEKEKEENMEMNADAEYVKEPVSPIKSSQVEPPSCGVSISKPQVVHKNSVGQVDPELKDRSSNQRSIPVKHVEAPKENNSERAERREKSSSQTNVEDSGMGRASKTSTKRESSSPQKASKLTPICLRVDPMPKKRNGSISSRSPSPPGLKGHSQDTTKASVSSQFKAQNHQDSQIQDNLSSNKEEEAKKNGSKVTEVLENKTSENKDEEQRRGSQIPISFSSSDGSEEVVCSSQTTKKVEKCDAKSMCRENEGFKNVDELKNKRANEEKETINADKSGDGEPLAEKKVLSNEDAALCIQSAYRGFEVRKWEPLKKLKNIAKVREEVAEVRNKIHGLESSPELQKDEKQRAAVGEMIMNLLLKLDTIQGLHSSLRDVRKALARELVTLQEKLDLLAQNTPEYQSCDPVSTEERQSTDMIEQRDHDVCNTMDAVLDTRAKEMSKPSAVVIQELKESKNDGQLEPFEANGSVQLDENSQFNRLEGLQQAANDMKLKPTASAEEEIGTTMTGTGQLREEEESNISSGSAPYVLNVNESTTIGQTPEMNVLKELPVGAIDDDEPDKQEYDVMQENKTLPDADVVHTANIDAAEQQPTGANNEGYATIDESLSAQQTVEVLKEELSQTDAPSPDKEILIQSDSEQQPVDLMKVEEEKDDVCNGDTIPERGVEQMQEALEVDNSNEHVDGSHSHPQEIQEDSSLEKESNEGVQKEVCLEISDKDTSSISETAAAVIPSQVEDAGIGEAHDNMDQETEGHTQEERKCVVAQLSPMVTKNDEEKKEVSIMSSAASQLYMEEQGIENDRKLVESNEKMREMVEQLIKAGKQQLDVIHNLNGRVKDLEKKLSRRKKIRAGRCRRAISSPRKGAVNVAV